MARTIPHTMALVFVISNTLESWEEERLQESKAHRGCYENFVFLVHLKIP